MKSILSDIAIKLIENNFSMECITLCGGILKEAFILQGFSRVVSNEMAIDGMKIVFKTIQQLNK